MKPRAFRVRCKVGCRVGVKSPMTAPFAYFGDANRWAMDYARGNYRPCRATVILDGEGTVLADYVGDGEGRVRCVDEHIGKAVA